MKETTSFKWTREDGKYVVIENNVATAFDADGNELVPDTDEAVDLFVGATMVMEETLFLPHVKGDEDADLSRRLCDAFNMMRRGGPGFGGPMFCGPMFSRHPFMFHGPMMHHHICNGFSKDKEEKSEEEMAYDFRKEEMEMMRQERQRERRIEEQRRQEIIKTSVPYEAPEICPEELITESNRDYLKTENGTTIVNVGHDCENRILYNIIGTDHRFILQRHQYGISRITGNRILIHDENGKYAYFDADTRQTLFSSDTIVNTVAGGLFYSDSANTYCYDTDGNLVATVDKDFSITKFIGGRPVIERPVKENEYEQFGRICNLCYGRLYNLVLSDGTLLFKDNWQTVIRLFGYEGRFLAQSPDGYTSVYSTDTFSLIYKSEKPRRLKEHYYNSGENELYIFNAMDENLDDTDSGIIVDVETGEVVSKDKNGNIVEYSRIEYPRGRSSNWRAEISVKTTRMEAIDPRTGKRVRHNKD